jgi:hypothetical protein
MKKNKAISLALFSLGGSTIATVAYIIACYVYAPEGDEVRQLPFYYMFLDPFVLTVAAPFTLVSTATAFVISMFTLRNCSLRRAIPIVFGSVIVAIVIFTPVGILATLAGSWAAMIISMVLCREKLGNFHSKSSIPTQLNVDP